MRNSFHPRLYVAVTILLAGLACAGRGPAASHGSRIVASPVSPGLRVLGGDELRSASGSTALDVVQTLRPLFLKRRGPLHAPTVFVDNVARGGVEELRAIPASSIAEIRYLDSRAATQQFGTGYTGGVIHVLSGRNP